MLNIDDVLYLKLLVANQYMKRHNIQPQELLIIAEEHHLFEYLDRAYGRLHLSGTEGIMREIDDYLRGCVV